MIEIESQIKWLTEMQTKIREVAAELTRHGDAILPRGFALGKVNDAALKMNDAARSLEEAIWERHT